MQDQALSNGPLQPRAEATRRKAIITDVCSSTQLRTMTQLYMIVMESKSWGPAVGRRGVVAASIEQRSRP